MNPKKIEVAASGTAYDILVGSGLLGEECGKQIRRVLPQARRAVVVTDDNVGALYADQVAEALRQENFFVSVHTFPAGEKNKTLESVAGMYGAFAAAGLTRSDTVVALGGGVTGDMAGFAAATWLRGIRLVQIPTTLLAQVDSSIGGKTGVNLETGKNLVGSFYAPSLVLIDPDTLSTLSPRVFSDGMAEVIKYGCIQDKALFERLEREQAQDFLEDMIVACAACKAGVVTRDERESGERILLNFGHTLGHALEKIYDYSGLTHGEAVGIGMVRISRAGEQAGLTAPGTADRIARLLEKYQLPARDAASVSSLAQAAGQDKKHTGADIRLVLLREIGQSMVYPLPAGQLKEFITLGV